MKIGSFDFNTDGTYIIAELSANHDANFSLDKAEFAEMIQAVRGTEKLLGKVDYSITEKKKKSRQFSRSLYIAEDIKKGEIFTRNNIRSVRPEYGMHPKYLEEILNKLAARDYYPGDRLDT